MSSELLPVCNYCDKKMDPLDEESITIPDFIQIGIGGERIRILPQDYDKGKKEFYFCSLQHFLDYMNGITYFALRELDNVVWRDKEGKGYRRVRIELLD